MKIRPVLVAISLGIGFVSVLMMALTAVSSPVNAYMDDEGIIGVNRSAPMPIITQVIATDAGIYSALTVDSEGQLHASLTYSDGNDIVYAVFSHTNWLTSSVGTGSLVARNDIALDQSNIPHLSFEKGGDLWHGIFNPVSELWTLTNLVSAGATNHRQNAIALDSQNNPFVTYSADWMQSVYWFGDVAFFDVNDDSSEDVDIADEEIHAPISLVLDSQDNPHILYKKRGNGGAFRVTLQSKLNDAWQRTDLESAWYNTFPNGEALTIDDNDNLYWSYTWHGLVVSGTLLPKTQLVHCFRKNLNNRMY